MAGRRPKPTAVKKLNGNPGKRPLNKNEPQPQLSIPECPTHLSVYAKEEWSRLSEELHGLGLLTRIDRAALAAYCQVWGRWVEAEEVVVIQGLTVATLKRDQAKNPHLDIADRCLKQMREYLVEFGMTPSSRSRLSIKPRSEEDEETKKRKRILGPQLVG